MSEEELKDMIEPIPNWKFTYRYDGSRNCGKSYTQSLLDEKDKEIERLNNIIGEIEIISGNRMNTILEIEKYCNDEKEDLISGGEVCEDILKIIDELKENNK